MSDNDALCINCGDTIWLHPELDYDGGNGNGCDKFEVTETRLSNPFERVPVLLPKKGILE